MLEIKVQCDCGQRYKFDVEPVNGLMPFVVNCPICGREGTEKANDILRQLGVTATSPPAPAVASLAGAAPMAGEAPKLRLSAAAPVAAHSAAVAAAPPNLPPAPAPTAMRGQPAPAAGAAPVGRKPNFGLGLLGAFMGAAVGSLIYFAVFNFAHLRLKLLAVGVGYLAGFGADLLGRKEGSKELGMLAATFTLIGIVGMQYLVLHNMWMSDLGASPKNSGYEAQVAEAKKVIAAVPTGSDDEIRLYLAKEDLEPGEKPDPKSVDDESVKEFRQTTLPEMRDLASGKLTQADYEKKLQADTAQTKAEKDSEEGTFKAFFVVYLISKLNLFSLAAAAGVAFKVCANA